jgi:hypothetical protein
MASKLSTGSLTIAGDDNKAYPDNWIGMSDKVDGGSKWLHIGGITDAGARRITLQADRVHVSGRLGVGTTDPQSALHVNGGVTSDGDLTVNGKLTVTGSTNLVKMAQKVIQVQSGRYQQGGDFQFDLEPGAFTEVYGAVASVLGYNVSGWSGSGFMDRNHVSYTVQVDAVDTKRVHGTARTSDGTQVDMTIAVTVFGRG